MASAFLQLPEGQSRSSRSVPVNGSVESKQNSGSLRGLRRSALKFGFLMAVPVLAWSQITVVHVTSCGPLNLPAACLIPATGTGNLIVVGFMTNAVNTTTTVSSITDNSGNTYAEAGAARAIDTAVPDSIDIWYAKKSVAGATSVTVTPSAGINASVVIWEFSGIDQTAPLDRTAVLNSQAPTALVTGAAVTTTSSPEVVISIANVSGSLTGIASGNGFTNDSTLFASGWAHAITSSTGTFAAQWNQTAAGSFDSSTVSFKAASSGTAPPTTTACDINKDGSVNVVDVQLAAGNYVSCSNGAFQTFYSQVVTGALNSCPVSTGLHTVALNWQASSSTGVTYNVYRASSSGGYNYTAPLNTTPITGTSFSDCTLTLGQTYYYVIRAVDSSGNQSVSSSEITAIIPGS
jgi:hypothetical protein